MKINLRESLNKIDLATDNKYDLLNTFDSKKLSDENKKKLAEAIENNSIASINRVLHESKEQLYKVVIQSGATKRDFESALYEDEAEGIIDYYGGRWIDENGFEWSMYVEEDDDSTEHAAVDNSYDMDEFLTEAIKDINSLHSKIWNMDNNEKICLPNGYCVKCEFYDSEGKAKRYIVIDKEDNVIIKGKFGFAWQPQIKKFEEDFFNLLNGRSVDESLTEASYGGAYDIEDDVYFTKEEIVEFADNICEDLAKEFGYKYDIADVYMDSPTKLHIELIDNHDIEVDINVRIDMRRIKKPSDLEKAYHNSTLESFKNRFLEEYQYYDFNESLDSNCDKSEYNELESLQEKLNNSEKNTVMKSIINAEEDELQKIVDEVYFYDRALYLKLRHFVKKNSLNDKKDYLIKVLQDSLEESLTEDTIKQNGKWVNKGSEGTHGKFRTKKAADAQRKAMYSRGFKSESLNEDFDDEYESDFDDNEVEEGNHVFADGEEYVWVERIAGPIYLDFDKWAVWSARVFVDPRDFMTIHSDGKNYDFDGDAFKKKAMAAPIVYFVVEEDTGFIDWGPVESRIEAQDFLNGKKEDWENDIDESLNEDKELNEYYIVNLHYEDVGDGREYDYEADYDDVLEYLMEICIDDDNAPEDTQEYVDWVETNFDYLLKKYEYRVLNYFEEDASQEEYDRRHSSYKS